MHRNLRRLTLALLPVVALGSYEPAYAQVLPTGEPGVLDQRAAERYREIRREALRGTNRLLQEWRQAWNEDDLTGLLELYTEEAVVLPPEGERQVRGRDAIGEFLGSVLDGTGEMEIRLSDFDGTTRLAYALGTFTYTRREASGSNGSLRRITGECVFVLRRDRSDWKIRSQMFEIRG